MFYPTRTTRKVPLQTGSHHSPPQAGAITHCIVGVADIQHALLNQIHDLFVESDLEPIADVPGKFLVELDRLLSNRSIERHRALNRFGRGLAATDHFNQRNDVWRIERMPDEYTLGVFAIRLHDAWRDARRARGNDRV